VKPTEDDVVDLLEGDALFAVEVRDSLIGMRLAGRYRVDRRLGAGGMGVVYAAEHVDLGRPVAIKVIREEAANDEAGVARFLQEARTAGRLGHPNVVDVFDLGRLEDGRPFMVMPLLRGMDFEQMLHDRGAQDPLVVAEHLEGAATALDAMHAQGLVHRDIKPENLFLAIHDDGGTTTLVMDFGLAALQHVGSRLTRQGMVIGTPHYLPPECASGSKMGALGDVYALAVVAYELISGALPFDADNPTYVLAQKMTKDAPAISSVAERELPAGLDAFFARALSRDPTQRPATCGALLAELRAACTTEREAAPKRAGTDALAFSFSEPPPPQRTERESTGRQERPRAPVLTPDEPVEVPRRRWAPVALATATVLGVLTVGLWLGLRTTEPEVATAQETAADPPVVEVPEAEVAEAPRETTEPVVETGTRRAEVEAEPVVEAPETAVVAAPEPTVMTASDEPDETRAPPSNVDRSPAQDRARAAALTREGNALAMRGLLPQAITKLTEATLAAPRYPAAWRSLGIANQRMNRIPEARRAFERYLRLAPGARDTDAIRGRLERL